MSVSNFVAPKLFPHHSQVLPAELVDTTDSQPVCSTSVVGLCKLMKCWDDWLARQRAKFLPLVQISLCHGLVSGLSAVWQQRTNWLKFNVLHLNTSIPMWNVWKYLLKNKLIRPLPSEIQNSVPLMLQLSHLWCAHGYIRGSTQCDACQIHA